MQTEIDQFLTEQNALLSQQNKSLAEQNALLSQQIDSLQTILSSYNELEQSLNNKIHSLETENETMKKLISAMKLELLKLEQGKFSEEYQQKLLNNWNNQHQKLWTQALTNQDLIENFRNFVQVEMTPYQKDMNSQKIEIKSALLKISQMPAPKDYNEELQTISEQVDSLEKKVMTCNELILNLSN